MMRDKYKAVLFLKLFIFTGLLILMFSNCEPKEQFIRPNMPEKLCSIGIIDEDDTSRYISFEKSYQSEYPEEANDSLRNLTFSILSSDKQLFYYQNQLSIKNLLDFKLPDSINFISDEKYFLLASEKNSPDILATVTVPSPSPELKLISVERELTNLTTPQQCTGLTYIKNVVISISFKTSINNNQYYAILLKGTGYSYSSSIPSPVISYLDFSIRDCNSPGFFAVLYGLSMYHWQCNDNQVYLDKSKVNSYFIDGNKIPDGIFSIVISAKFQDTYSLIDILNSFELKLLTIPEELYLFEKSLYTYNQIQNDPFSEPVYLNGNIKGGNGVFALCRSRQLNFKFSPFY